MTENYNICGSREFKVIDGQYVIGGSECCNIVGDYAVCDNNVYEDVSIFEITFNDGTIKTYKLYNDDFGDEISKYIGTDAFIVKCVIKQLKSSVKSLTNMFYSCETMQEFICYDLKNVEDLSYTFAYCKKLKNITIKGNKVKKLSNSFRECNYLTEFPQIDTSNVTDFSYAFYNCYKLTEFPVFNTGNGINFSYAFAHTSATKFPEINLSKAENLNHTWFRCENLAEFPQIDTSNVTDFYYTWAFCAFSSFPKINTDKAENLNHTWYGCNNLKNFGGVTNCSVAEISTWMDTALNPKPCGQ